MQGTTGGRCTLAAYFTSRVRRYLVYKVPCLLLIFHLLYDVCSLAGYRPRAGPLVARGVASMVQARLWVPAVLAIISWDSMGYYFYLTAHFICHDLSH